MPYQLKDSMSVGLLGDIIQNKHFRACQDESFLKLVSALRGCDAVFANLESLYHDWEMTYRSAYTRTAIVTPPEMLDELRWLGITAGAGAMNHSWDCGEAGLVAMIANGRKYRFPIAGIGMSAGEARSPVFVETAGGRIAFLAGTTPFSLPEESHAGPPGIGIPAKPGVAILRYQMSHTVPTALFRQLQDAQRALVARPSKVTGDKVQIFGGSVEPGEDYSTVTKCHSIDLEQIVTSIRSARKVSDLVVYSLHCHENGTEGEYYNGIHRPYPPEFLVEFAHHCIDNGCDVVFSHGPHILRGIEIYKGKPIFYSLGNFFFELATLTTVTPFGFTNLRLPADAGAGTWGDVNSSAPPYFWENEPECYQSVIPVCTIAGGELRDIRLIPIELGFGTPHSQRGRPVVAPKAVADEILVWLREKSQAFGTEIGDGEGLIRLDRMA